MESGCLLLALFPDALYIALWGLRKARARACGTQVFGRNLRAKSRAGIQSSMHLSFSPIWHPILTISAGELALDAKCTLETQLRVGYKRLRLGKLSASRLIDL